MRSITNDFVMQRPPFGGRLKDSLFLTTHFSPNLHPQKSKISGGTQNSSEADQIKRCHPPFIRLHVHAQIGRIRGATHACLLLAAT